jgi:hypothetical protein
MSDKITLFISYAHEDTDVAKKIYHDLKQAGLEPWLDKKCLLPGQKWKITIKEAIRNSRFFIALLSSKSVSKTGFVNKELTYALELLDEFPESNIFIIPVRLDDCIPSHDKLKEIHRVDLFPKWEDGLEKILHTIQFEFQNSKEALKEKGHLYFQAKKEDNAVNRLYVQKRGEVREPETRDFHPGEKSDSTERGIKGNSLRLPLLVLTRAFLILTILASVFFTTCIFFKWPYDLGKIIQNNGPPKVQNITIIGSVRNQADEPITGAQITVDAYDFEVRSKGDGNFISELRGAAIGDIITLMVTHRDYKTFRTDRKIQKLEESFTFILKRRKTGLVHND